MQVCQSPQYRTLLTPRTVTKTLFLPWMRCQECCCCSEQIRLQTSPEILAGISEFVAKPRSRQSMFEIVKMTHVCQYWKSALISPHLWSSIFVKNDHPDFVAACLKRSQEVPLTMWLDLKYGDYDEYPDCVYGGQAIILDAEQPLPSSRHDRPSPKI